jgi:hypothetical protein
VIDVALAEVLRSPVRTALRAPAIGGGHARMAQTEWLTANAR